jgi:predicted DNA-binding transcriptional regulator YafY
MIKFSQINMRADRLLSILLLLQTQGRHTAKQLASELEVSERTIYRDMDALSSAGVPVYAERGPGGGCSLLESYRTNLTGLTRDEVSALFMLSIPTPLVDLGLDQDLKTALLKLSAALPDLFRQQGFTAHEKIHLDPSAWSQQAEFSPHLAIIQQGLRDDLKLELTYLLAFGARVHHLVEPLGLVAKENNWYFIFSRGDVISVVRLADILETKLTQGKFSVPADFNLVEFWNAWCSQRESNRSQYHVKVRLKSELLAMLKLFRHPVLLSVEDHEQIDQDGWHGMTLQFETFERARQGILGFGGAVEVISPPSLRKSVQDYANQISGVYN